MKLRDFLAVRPIPPVERSCLVTIDLPQTEVSQPVRRLKIADRRLSQSEESEAVRWLRQRLFVPQRITLLITEWVGPLETPTGRTLDELRQGRHVVGLEAFVGEDGRFWWRLPTSPHSESEVSLFPWLCPHCGRPATIEDVFPSLDGERTLTMWRCDPCQVVAVTPDTIKEPPSGWVKRVEQ